MATAPLRGLGYGETELGSPAGKILAQDPVLVSRIACWEYLVVVAVMVEHMNGDIQLRLLTGPPYRSISWS